MSEEQERGGAPVTETEASATEVQATVERAAEPVLPAAVAASPLPEAGSSVPEPAAEPAGVGLPAAQPNNAQPTVAQPTVAQPVAGAPVSPPQATEVLPEALADPLAGAQPTAPMRPEIPPAVDLPSAGPVPAPATAVFPAEASGGSFGGAAMDAYGVPRDGEIRISADHPMAALYMQTPMPPDLKGNRGAGVLIALLATVAFAAVFAGIVALLLAPQLPPSQFVGGLLSVLLAWPTILAVSAFFVGLVVVVLVVGRAGWWAYVLGGFLVAMFVWAASIAGIIIADRGVAGLTRIKLDELADIAFLPYVLVAVLVAREVTVWFGAWIGSRGRKVTRANADALVEYEQALAEVQAKQP